MRDGRARDNRRRHRNLLRQRILSLATKPAYHEPSAVTAGRLSRTAAAAADDDEEPSPSPSLLPDAAAVRLTDDAASSLLSCRTARRPATDARRHQSGRSTLRVATTKTKRPLLVFLAVPATAARLVPLIVVLLSCCSLGAVVANDGSSSSPSSSSSVDRVPRRTVTCKFNPLCSCEQVFLSDGGAKGRRKDSISNASVVAEILCTHVPLFTLPSKHIYRILSQREGSCTVPSHVFHDEAAACHDTRTIRDHRV